MLTGIFLTLMLVFILLICFFRDLLYAAVSLAIGSIILSIILFRYAAHTAAVFELSVCAGLITVLFVSTVSLTKNSDQKVEARLPRYFAPFFLLLFAGLSFLLVNWLTGHMAPATLTFDPPVGFRETFWGTRTTDLLGQISLILAGVFGILAIFRETREGRKHA